VDVEKAFDRVPREVIRWAVHKLRVEEYWYRQSCLCILVQKQLLEQFVLIVAVLRYKLACTKVQH